MIDLTHRLAVRVRSRNTVWLTDCTFLSTVLSLLEHATQHADAITEQQTIGRMVDVGLDHGAVGAQLRARVTLRICARSST